MTQQLLLIGSSSVGKSSLLLRFTDDTFLSADEISSTIGVDFKLKMLDHKASGRRFKLSIWDTAGQERFRTLTSSYYRGAQGVILMYDISNRETFDALNTWFTELDTFASQGVVKYVVANKTDKESARVVSKQEGQNFALSKGALFKEVSAKRNEGVQEVFDKLVDEIVARPELWNKSHQSQTSSVPGGFPSTVTLDGQNSSSWSSCSC
ncbi:ras-domain-containing protein [Cystobasidium minutum MCA 4210]|uniref:ras-domain-containing protein n=1 Tax=Cystobasidium minutum MCA 4210 TaxID=1397322 RepID=UPI0034CD7674|eukprot:jgi/Rhomi1/199188/MIX17_1198_57